MFGRLPIGVTKENFYYNSAKIVIDWKGMKMKRMNVEYVLVALSLMAFAFSTNTWAEDVADTEKFMALCTESPFNSRDSYEPACCELMLKSYSDGYREGIKRQLPFFEKQAKMSYEAILRTPGMTNEKIDAVCSLSDSAEEQKWLAEVAMGAGDREGYRLHLSHSKQLREQSEELFLSYVSGVNSSGTLSAFRYCHSRNQLNQSKKDLKEDDGKLFPSVKRKLKKNSLRTYQEILRATRHVKCRKK